jgi:hypothetical protein
LGYDHPIKEGNGLNVRHEEVKNMNIAEAM